jgi:hypothetical protein
VLSELDKLIQKRLGRVKKRAKARFDEQVAEITKDLNEEEE